MEIAGKSKINSRQGGACEVDLDARFECPICLQCLKDPVLTACGHRFCDNCIRPWLSTRSPCLCPVDNLPLSINDLFPDHYTRREILGQIKCCPECEKDITLSEYDSHVAGHNIKCTFYDVGCVKTLDKPLNTHLTEKVVHHLNLISKKLNRGGKEQESNLWVPDKNNHAEDSLVRNLYERIVIAEQKILELQNQVQVTRQSAESAITRLQQSHGEFVWRVQNIKELVYPIKDGTGERSVRFSPAFSTSPMGYRLCARINLASCSEQISFVIHLLRSEHDDTLDWPLSARIKISLVHPHNPETTISETVMSQPRLGAFKRPNTDMSPKAFGFPEFISVTELYGLGFVKDDVVTFRVAITCV